MEGSNNDNPVAGPSSSKTNTGSGSGSGSGSGGRSGSGSGTGSGSGSGSGGTSGNNSSSNNPSSSSYTGKGKERATSPTGESYNPGVQSLKMIVLALQAQKSARRFPEFIKEATKIKINDKVFVRHNPDYTVTMLGLERLTKQRLAEVNQELRVIANGFSAECRTYDDLVKKANQIKAEDIRHNYNSDDKLSYRRFEEECNKIREHIKTYKDCMNKEKKRRK